MVNPATTPSVMRDLDGHVALVTGGIGGIGQAIVRRLALEGAHVIAADIAPYTCERVRTMVDEWRAADLIDADDAARVEGAVVDITDADAVAETVGDVNERFGRLDILINNAGLGGKTAPVWETELGSWHRHIAVGLTGTFLMCRAFVPLMLRHDYGRIVNISSMAGKEGNIDTSPYSAAKAGVLGLTKTLGKELAQTGVLANAVTPGVVVSPMNSAVPSEHHERVLSKIPMGRPGRPEELAELVGFLAGPRVSFSTGAIFDFSGGRATY